MKKTISLVLVFIFAFILTLQLPVLANDGLELNDGEDSSLEVKATSSSDAKATSSLEKISSPALMNLYREIKKIGGDLFGIKKASSTIYNIQKNDDKKATEMKKEIEKRVAEVKKSGMEKITSLDQVKFFEKITKVGNDLFGIKKKGAMILPVMNTDLITCVSNAIDAKDSSINITFTSSATEITTAIDARGVCQKAALVLTAGREDALKACTKTFQLATKTANEKAKKAQQEAWTTYKTGLKACSTTAKTTEINIEDGGEILK
jgi:hypothetical protein